MCWASNMFRYPFSALHRHRNIVDFEKCYRLRNISSTRHLPMNQTQIKEEDAKRVVDNDFVTMFPVPRQQLTSKLKPNVTSQDVFHTKPYKLHRLESGPSTEVTMTRTEGLQYFRQLSTIRQTAIAVEALFKEGHIRGRCHHHSGQEASLVGIEAAITGRDSVISNYRTLGWCYTRGIPLRQVIGELLGRTSGIAKGKSGAMYMKGNNFYGGHGIVGAQVLIGTGLAFAHKYKNEENVCVTLYGDGTSNQGQVYEAFNMAKLWNLPCVFVCENNGYAIWTSAERGSAKTDFYSKGDYVPGIWVDGMDVLAVREAIQFAKQFALTQGPIIVELELYLYLGHSISHPGTFSRLCEQVEKRKYRDPIGIHISRMTSSNLATFDELLEIESDCKREIDNTARICLEDPPSLIEDTYTHVYKDTPRRL